MDNPTAQVLGRAAGSRGWHPATSLTSSKGSSDAEGYRIRGCEGFSAASYVKGQRVLGDGKQLIPVIIG